MIYITGDTHIPEDIHKLSVKCFPEQKTLSKNDFVIICGDFGGIWDDSNEEKYWLKWLSEKNFTTLFIDGNHENFDRLAALPIVSFCGGRAHMTADGIYHLMRSEIYTIDEKKFFTFGGASSHDKKYRKENVSWLKAELPTAAELDYAEKNLIGYNRTVDYVITHCAADSVQNALGFYDGDILTEFFERLDISYKQWFFGHYHIDKKTDEKHTCVFNRLIRL